MLALPPLMKPNKAEAAVHGYNTVRVLRSVHHASIFFFNRVIAAVFYMKPRVIIEIGMLLLLVLVRTVFLSLVDLFSEREARASGSHRVFQKSLRYPTVSIGVLKSSWNTTPYSQSDCTKFWRRIECKIGCTRDGISDRNKWPGSCLYSECGRGVRGSTWEGIVIAFFVFRRLVSRRFLGRKWNIPHKNGYAVG